MNNLYVFAIGGSGERIMKSLKKIAKSTQITETDKIRETDRTER